MIRGLRASKQRQWGRTTVLLGIVGLVLLLATSIAPQVFRTAGVSTHSASGSDIHALIEWLGVGVALAGACIYATHYRLRREPVAAFVGWALLIAALFDTFHTLASVGLLGRAVLNGEIVPFTFACARSASAGALLIGLGVSVLLQQRRSNARQARKIVFFASMLILGLAALLGLVMLTMPRAPRTTFPDAIITRPFDLLPLAMILVVFALARGMRLHSQSRIPEGLMLSMLLASFAQLHIALGATAAYDPHFLLAHLLKSTAYVVLLVVPLVELSKSRAAYSSHKKEPVSAPTKPASIRRELIEVGIARRPLGVVLPIVAFFFTFLMVLIVAFSFYIESERLLHSERWSQVTERGRVLVPLVEGVFQKAEADLLFLSRTASLSKVSRVNLDDQSSLEASRTILEEAFVRMLHGAVAFDQIRYFALTEGRPEIVAHVKRTPQGVARVRKTQVVSPTRSDLIHRALTGQPGQVLFSKMTVREDGGAWFSLTVPLFELNSAPGSQHPALVGLLEAEVPFSNTIDLLTDRVISDASFIVALEDGTQIFNNHDQLLGSGARLKGALAGADYSRDEVMLHDTDGHPIARVLATSKGIQGEMPRVLVAVSFPVLETYQTLVDFRNRAFAIGAALALLALALALIASSRIVRPLRQLSEALERGNDITLLDELPVHARDEVGVLARGFHNLFGQLDGAMRQQRAALLSAQNQRQALDEHAIVAMTDVHGSIIYANDRFCQISGYAEEELVGENHSVVTSGLHGPEFWKEMFANLSAGKTWHQQICNRRKDGQLYWVDSTVVPFKGESGRPESYVSIATDITERVLAERELARSVALLAATLDSTADGILVTDLGGKVLQANERLCSLFQWPRDELLVDEGRALRWQMAAQFLDPKQFTLVENVLREYPHENVAEVLKFTHGRIYERDSRAMVIDGHLEGFVFSYRDVSARAKNQAELIAAKEAAEEASAQKANFLASMSHEIRTPMNGVLGMLGLLLDGELQPEQRHEAELARSSAEALLGLINDILDFSKVEAGRLELEEIEFDLHAELGEFSEAVALRCEDKGLSLVLDMVGIQTPVVVGDPGRLRQILMNLVGNAIKFTSKGEVLLSVVVEPNDQGLRLFGKVRDHGIGIPADKINTLFDKFTQVDASTTRKYGGSGLGLAIVGQLCQLMGGSVSVESELGEGSEFRFEVQLQRGSSLATDHPLLEGKHILVVDGGPELRDALGRQLRAWGAEVSLVSSFESAVLLMNEPDFPRVDSIFIDQQLTADGTSQYIEWVRQQPKFAETCLIAMTSLRRRLRGVECQQRGFDASFPKPITMSALVSALSARGADPISPLALSPSTLPLSDSSSYLRSSASGSLRLLIVEDNPVNQKVARGTLTRLGFHLVDIAMNGQQALEALRNAPAYAPYDLVLMDCQMPEMDGYEAVRRIRQGQGGARYKELPVIAMTANAMNGDREKCLSAGMNDYLTKPIQRQALREALLKWLPAPDHDPHPSENQYG